LHHPSNPIQIVGTSVIFVNDNAEAILLVGLEGIEIVALLGPCGSPRQSHTSELTMGLIDVVRLARIVERESIGITLELMSASEPFGVMQFYLVLSALV
jgi:hypothetical protein